MDCTQSARTRQALPQRRQPTTMDVTVIGAGPVGALLAYLLTVRGLRVVLVEKARLPRVKPCGGGLNWKTVALLPCAIDPVIERIVSRVVFTMSSGCCVATPTSYAQYSSYDCRRDDPDTVS